MPPAAAEDNIVILPFVFPAIPLAAAGRRRHMGTMEIELIPTVILSCVASALAIFCGYMGQRPMNPNRGPRMVPWRFLMLLFVVAAMMLIVHLLNLLGFTTGQQQPKY
ncbi:hypothetical protein [Asticcacaulis solisilvae]|uniref:hypothetical protein n=1 Tax=Asticcacaulis solisilvae TaxID=1217274 RepID=UPI003FD6D30C